MRTLAATDFKLRYAGSSFGYLWAVSKPLMLFGVMYLVFSRILRFGEGIEHYPLILLAGIMLWGFFSETTSAAVTVLVSRSDMLRKASFPRSALPVSVVATGLLVFLFNFMTLFVFALLGGLAPSWTWLLLLPLILELGVLTIGMSLLLSGLFVYMRDIGQAWAVALQALFYATPIIYPIEMLEEQQVETWVRTLMLSNPMAQIVHDARWALTSGGTSSTAELMGPAYAVPFGLVALSLVVGTLTYRRYAAKLAENV